MANRLKMATVHAIGTLKRQGWSQRRIARFLGIDRRTVKRHLDNLSEDSNATTNAPTGSMAEELGDDQEIKRSGEYLFEIVMRRYEIPSTMMTSNRPLEDWGKLVGDVPSAAAILDRFLHHAEIIQITGKSYRMKDGVNQNGIKKSKSDGQDKTCKQQDK